MVSFLKILGILTLILAFCKANFVLAIIVGENIILNPSVEYFGAFGQPFGWSRGNWGENSATFTYVENDGHASSHSLEVSISSYVSGDAKWYFSFLSALPSSEYTFSFWYKSNIPTRLVLAAQIGTDGSMNYEEIASRIEESPRTWRFELIPFVTPAECTKLSLFHILEGVGFLRTDNFILTSNPSAPFADTNSASASDSTSSIINLIANPSVEFEDFGNPDLPYMWHQEFSGQNVGQFAYKRTDGDVSDSSLYIQVSNYATGGLKWYFDLVPVYPEAKYRFSVRYKSSISTKVVLLTLDQTGAQQFQELDILPPSPQLWNKFATKFFSPTNALKVTIFIEIQQVGFLQTDNYVLSHIGFTDSSPLIPTVGTPSLLTDDIGLPILLRSNTSEIKSPLAIDETFFLQIAGNLIFNPSLEVVNPISPNFPLHWDVSNTGKNQLTTEYIVGDGHDFSRSFKLMLSSYESGEAKLFFRLLSVSEMQIGRRLSFNFWYKSSTSARVQMVTFNTNQEQRYEILRPTIPLSALEWTFFSLQVNLQEDVNFITLAILIDSEGFIQLDDFFLNDENASQDTTVSPEKKPQQGTSAEDNLENYYISNPSLEILDSSNRLPENWNPSSWGANSPRFEVVTKGAKSGANSAKITMDSYFDGEAMWQFVPVVLPKERDYRFSVSFKTNAEPFCIAMHVKSSGDISYSNLPRPRVYLSETEWNDYSEVFTVPNDAVATSVFMAIRQIGFLETDQYSIVDYTYSGFSQGIISMVFTNGFADHLLYVLPTLKQFQLRGTHCYSSSSLETFNQRVDLIDLLVQTKQEICSHATRNAALTTITRAEQKLELVSSKDYLEKISGLLVSTMSSPFGDYDERALRRIQKVYSAHVALAEGFNSPDNIDPMQLRVQNLSPSITRSQFQSWVRKAHDDHLWLILMYDQVTFNAFGEFDTSALEFIFQASLVKNSGVSVLPISDALKFVEEEL